MHNIVYATLWKLVENLKKFKSENPLHLRVGEPTLLFVSARMLHRRCQRVEIAENDAIGHRGRNDSVRTLYRRCQRAELVVVTRWVT